jgi:hypothetical protein
MKSYRRLHEHSWLLFVLVATVAFMSVGCSSSTSSSGSQVNPLGAYQPESTDQTGTPTDGSTGGVGAIDKPIISSPPDGQGTINGHQNAPLLDNMHPGWQQSSCLSCHNEQSRNPDHNYIDATHCYLCHGTNGLPGFSDNVPPIISGVTVAPTYKSAVVTWNTDEDCLSRIVVRTTAGDRLEFPVSMTYSKTHRYDIPGLQAETNYIYELICTDKSQNKTTSASFGTLSFTTAEKPSTTVSGGVSGDEGEAFFTDLSIIADSATTIKVAFTIPEAALVVAQVKRDGSTNVTTTTFNDDDDIPAGPYTGTLLRLQPDTKYTVKLVAQTTSQTFESGKYTVKTDSF